MKVVRRSLLNQLRISFLILIILSILFGLGSYMLLSNVTLRQEAKYHSSEVVGHLAAARQAEKSFLLEDRKSEEFLTTGRSSLLSVHDNHLKLAIRNLKEMAESSVATDLNMADELSKVESSFKRYESVFARLVNAYHMRGFKDHGLEGEMREYVHALQQCESPEEKVFAYSLRRHEKDFMLRRDERYVDKLRSKAEEFKDFLRSSELPHMTTGYKEKTIQGIDNYQAHFMRIVDLEEEIGNAEGQGITGRLNEAAMAIAPQLDRIQLRLEESGKRLKQRAAAVMLGGLIILAAIGVWLALWLSKKISRPVLLLDNVAREVVEGHMDAGKKLAVIKREDEVGRLVVNFRQMLDSLNSHLAEVREQKEALEVAKAADEIRSHASDGLALFSDLLKNQYDTKEALGHAFISQLVTFTGANQATLFISEETAGKTCLRQVAAYAYNRKKKAEKILKMGEGLAGMAVLERDTIFMTEVPEDYVSIGSGLGHAKPRCILIVPVMTDENALGVIEIASFRTFNEHDIQFVEQVAGRLATTLASVNMQSQTRKLLEDSQQKEQELYSVIRELEAKVDRLTVRNRVAEREYKMNHQKEADYSHRVKVLDAIISKLYPGLIITDENFVIQFTNDFVTGHTGRSNASLAGTDIHKIIGGPLKETLEAIYNDPSFLISDISEHMVVPFYGISGEMTINMVMTIVKTDKKIFYGFLFRRHDPIYGRQLLKEILRREVNRGYWSV
ncbi:GAF domain-containing protein [Roseivirga sp. BDSF3-8]|uniref:GAF domain-containing protein n=1 Tax=Roseivirga sp. BDSF3-8 TaxID=3241598 RepID=UPI0035322964